MVPLHKVTNHRSHIHGIVGRYCRIARARHHEYRYAVAISVIDRHRCMLDSDGAMQQCQHRLVLDLGIAVRHRDGVLFVRAGQELGHFVFAVINERFMQPFKARSWIGGHILDTERLDHIDHEVRARFFDDPCADLRRSWSCVSCELGFGRLRSRSCRRRAALCVRGWGCRHKRRCAGSRAFQKAATVKGAIFLRHNSLSYWKCSTGSGISPSGNGLVWRKPKASPRLRAY